MTGIMVLVFFVLMAIAVPVAHAMLGGVGAALWLDGKSMAVLAQRLYTPTQSFPMLAIPFFILAGSLMISGKFGEYLINIARLIVDNMKGGLGQVSIIGSVMFGGVSGSAVADASALGNALIPVQKEEGYAAHSGLSRGAIQKARKSGRLVLFADGPIDAAASDAQRAATTDADQQNRSKGGTARQMPAPERQSRPADNLAAPSISGPGDSSTYLKARTALTVYQAQERQIAIQKKKGVLVDRARAKTLVFRLARSDRRPRFI